MSLGTGAFAEKIFEDDEIVSYNYGVYDLNEPELRNLAYIADGTIIIKKECFVEPEIPFPMITDFPSTVSAFPLKSFMH